MNSRLTKAEILEQLARMDLESKNGEKVRELVSCMDESGRVSSKKLAVTLFPGKAPKTVMDNTANRIRWINEAAGNADISLQAVLASDDSGWSGVQVEWVFAPPPEAMTQDLRGGGHLISLPASSELMQIDTRPIVLMVCNDFEAMGVEHFFDPDSESTEETKNGRTYRRLASLGEPQTPFSKGIPVIMVRSTIGLLAAAGTVEQACEDWDPQLIIGVGIAYGVDEEEQFVGDVLVSEATVESAENVRPDGEWYPRSRHISAPDECLVKMLGRNQQARNQGRPWPTLHFGTFLCANQKISNTVYRNKKVEVYRGFGIIGGDMESAGIASASKRHGVPWLIVKAISDWGTDTERDKGKDDRQKEAALRAARVVYAFVTQDFPTEPLGIIPGVREEQSELPEPTSPDPILTATMDLPEERRLTLLSGRYDMNQPLLQGDKNSRRNQSDKGTAPENADETSDILVALDAWIDDPAGKQLFAIFGDFGMGKTVTCQSFAKKRREVCQTTHGALWPLYFDLRKVKVNKGTAPTLMDTMLQCAQRGWKQAESVTNKDMWSWINRGAVVIFDGLDEVLTKLDEDDGQMYTDNLLSVINQANGPIRVLISSRSQFFRNLEEEKTRFTGAERSDKDSSWYEARWLLQLNEQQVRHYFEVSLPAMNVAMDVDQVMDMVSKVHNLSDLSRRPYTLKLVADAIPEIAQQRDKGLLVNGSTIYRKFARKWLRRDDLKHHIKLEAKLRLVEELAARLFTTGRTEVPIEELEEWFDGWRRRNRGYKRRKKISSDKLEEDLRNSTFLSRVDVSETQGAFRFAHTSLQEFFLSEYMLRALEENASEHWGMRSPSEETFGFLGMSLAEKDEITRQILLSTMGFWFRGTDSTINSRILNYRFYAGWNQLPQVTLPLIYPQIESVSVEEVRRLLKTMDPGLAAHVSVGGYSWTLLEKDHKTAFLLCDQIVDYQPYNTELAEVNWETCTLRTWLNRDFLSTFPQEFQDALAFVDASEEKAKVVTGAENADRLFLLSPEEVKEHLPKDKTRIAHRHDGDTWWWWLRSVGGLRDDAPVVSDDGTLDPDGFHVLDAYYGVRPALKMNL